MDFHLFEQYKQRIAALPRRDQYDKADLLTATFQLQRDKDLAIYYAPFGLVNPHAQVALIGITPGWQQMEIACRVAREGLLWGLPSAEILRRVKSQASFAGPMRKNLCWMLDGIGLPEQLGIASCASLFATHRHLVHTTSAVRYPVFKGGRDYTGNSPKMTRHHLLQRYLMTSLREELATVPHALVIALGKCVTQALLHLVEKGTLDESRCLLGFPHPSGANGHRMKLYEEGKDQLRDKVCTWFAQQECLVRRN